MNYIDESTAKGHLVLTPPRRDFFSEGSPGEITTTTLPLTLRHEDDGDIDCEIMIVCHYDADGELADVCGIFRQIPQSERFNEFMAWWKQTIDEARYVIMDIITLYPAPAAT